MAKQDEDLHYFNAIKGRLTVLYNLTESSKVREQISDEVDWVNVKLDALFEGNKNTSA